jgi:intein/homing endonuclease
LAKSNNTSEIEYLKSRGIALPYSPQGALKTAAEMRRMANTPGDLQNTVSALYGVSDLYSGNAKGIDHLKRNNDIAEEMARSRRIGNGRHMVGSRRYSQSFGNPGAFMDDVSLALPRFYDPLEFWDVSGLPWNMEDEGHRHKLHKWLRLYYATHYLVPILIDIFTRFPLVGMRVEDSDKELQDFYESLFLDKLDYPNFLVSLGREYWCALPDEIIQGKDGPIPIKDVVRDDEVLTHTGAIRKVRGVSYRPYQGKYVTLQPHYGLPMQYTYLHPFLVRREGLVDWIPIERVKATDELYVPVDKRIEDRQSVSVWETLSRTEWLPVPSEAEIRSMTIPDYVNWTDSEKQYRSYIRRLTRDLKPGDLWRRNQRCTQHSPLPGDMDVTDEFLWFIGLYLAEGCVTKDGVQIALHAKEMSYADRVIDFASTLGLNASIREGSSENGIIITIYSISFGAWMHSLIGTGCDGKRIPEWMMILPPDKQTHILRGYYDGDGCYGAPRVYATTKSLTLALQVERMIRRLKIVTAINKSSSVTKNGTHCQWYMIGPCKADTHKFMKAIGIDTYNHVDRKKAFADWDDNGYWVKVFKIEHGEYSGPVYNIEVEKDHSYVGSVATHNCVGEAFPLASFDEDLGVWEHEELINPENIVIKNFPLLDSSQLYLVPPNYLPLSVNTPVQLENGSIIKLDDIKVGDRVITHKGRGREVKGVYSQGKLPGLRITTETFRVIDTAYEHPFLTPDGWRPAKDLVEGDTLALIIPDENKPLNRPLEEYRLIGYFVGDGCCAIARKHKNGTETCCSYIRCFDKIEGKDILHCAKELGFEGKIGKDGTAYQISDNRTTRVQNWLREIGLHGKNCYTKRVPKFIFQSSNEQIAHFLGAYFATDGCISYRSKQKNHVAVSYYSVNKELLEDVRDLLLRLGIKSRIYLDKNDEAKRKINPDYPAYKCCVNSWTLTIYAKDDIAKFASLIPVFGIKAEKLKNNGNVRQDFDRKILPDRIKSIEILEVPIECKCLQVDEDSSFTANGIAVHNTKLAREKSPAREYKMLEMEFKELIPYLLKNEHIPVSNVLLKQVANKLTDWDDHGTPILMRGLRTLMHEEKLLASQDAIAERLYSPFILAKLGIMDLGDGQPPWIPEPAELEVLRDDIDLALASDFRLMVHHFGIDIQNVFGREQMPRLGDDFDRIEQRLMRVFGVNPTLLSAGAATQPYASSALQAEFLNQILRTYQGYLIKHYNSRAAIVAEAQGHYDFKMDGGRRVPVYEEVVVYDEEGNKNIETRPKLRWPKLKFESLDLRDEATERQFMQALRAQGVPISDERLVVGIDFDFNEEIDNYNEGIIKKTIAQQKAKMKAYTILKAQNLPIPPDLKAEVEGVLAPTDAGGNPILNMMGGGAQPGQSAFGAQPPQAGGAGGPQGTQSVVPPPQLGPKGIGNPMGAGGAPPATPEGPMGPSGGTTMPPVSVERRKGLPTPTSSVQPDVGEHRRPPQLMLNAAKQGVIEENSKEGKSYDKLSSKDVDEQAATTEASEIPEKIIEKLPRSIESSHKKYRILDD